MSTPQKYILTLTSTTRQPNMAKKKAQNDPNNNKIKKSKTKNQTK